MSGGNKAGYALLAAAVLAMGAVVILKRAPSDPPAPTLPPLPAGGATVLATMQAELDALRPAGGAATDPAVQALMVRLGRFGALGADDLAEALAAARGVEGAVPLLLDVLGSPPPDDAPRPNHAATDPAQRLRRADAARLLGAIGDSRAIPALGALLDSANADPYPQEAAAAALGKIGDRAALVPLRSFLYDDRPKDWRVIIAAAQSALELGCKAGGDEIVTVLTDWNPAMAKRPRVFDRERVLLATFRKLAGRDVAPFDPYMLPPQLKQAGDAWAQWWRGYRDTEFVIPSHARTSVALTDALLQRHLRHFDGRSFYKRVRAQRVLAGLADHGLPYLFHFLRHEDAEYRRLAADALGRTESRQRSLIVSHLVAAYRTEAAPLARVEMVKAVRRLTPDGTAEPGVAELLAAAGGDVDGAVRDAATAPLPPN